MALVVSVLFREIFSLPEETTTNDLEWSLRSSWSDEYYINSSLNDEICSLIFIYLVYETVEPKLAIKAVKYCDGCEQQLANQLGHQCLQPWDYGDFERTLDENIHLILAKVPWQAIQAEYVSRLNLNVHRHIKLFDSSFWKLRSRATTMKLLLTDMHYFLEKRIRSPYEMIMKEVFSLLRTRCFWDRTLDMNYLNSILSK